MSIKKATIFLLTSLFLITIVQLAYSGISGKIAGTVVAKDTGEPLPATNLIIVGTTLGAATDFNGHYVILNVPPGIYEIKAMMMGYSQVNVQNIRVRIDQTTNIDFELEQLTIAGEAITIVADKEIVKKDVATSVTSVGGDEIKEVPVTTINEVVKLHAGVQDNFQIRGGDASEMLFQVDGITLRDARNNQPITTMALSGIQELAIERGGFNAEYGQIRSGLVNVVSKEGSKTDYEGSITVKLSPPQAKYFGTSPFDPNSVFLKPFLDPQVAFVGTEEGWDRHTRAQYPEFIGWNEISKQKMESGVLLTPDAAKREFEWRYRRKEITDQPDYNMDVGFGGPVPLIGEKLGNLRFFTTFLREREMLLVPMSRDDFVAQDWSLKLSSDINSAMKLDIRTQMGINHYVAANADEQTNATTPISTTQFLQSPESIVNEMYGNGTYAYSTKPGRFFGNSYYSLADVSHKMYSAKLTHIINPSTYYETSIEYVGREYDTHPPDPIDNQLTEIVPGYFLNSAPFGYNPITETGIEGYMVMGGHTSSSRDNSKSHSTNISLDLTSQVNFYNQIKAGVEFNYSKLDIDYASEKPAFPDLTNHVKWNKSPITLGIYVQDKIEAQKGFIANIGFRFDYNDRRTQWADVSLFNQDYYTERYETTDIAMKDVKPDFSFSPRLSISHPITENSKLFFNYGHFKQAPTYERIYQVNRGAGGSMAAIGDPNLSLAKTVAYEIGYDHLIANAYLIQISAYYRDIKDQQAFNSVQNINGRVSYLAANNNSYADIRGLELTIKKTTGKWFTGFGNFTYRANTNGRFGKPEIYENPGDQKRADRRTKSYYQSSPVPQPYGRLSLTFTSPDQFGPELISTHLLSDWRLNFITNWQAGLHRVWNPAGIPLPPNTGNVKSKDFWDMSLRLSKNITVGNMDIQIFMDFSNLFNFRRLNLTSFSHPDDEIAYYNSLHLPEDDAYTNIVGEDKIGDFRKSDIKYQPIDQVGNINALVNPEANLIYYDGMTHKYMNYVNNNWVEVEGSRMDKILDDKAYIDMPNLSSFNFLNPRQIFFGIRTSFNF